MTGGPNESKLAIDRYAEGTTLCLRFRGTIDEDFSGKKAASGLQAETLLVDLGQVRRISSFGIREWVDFITAASGSCAEVILVECSPKVMHQLNMVANFAGGAAIFSFYAPYRCDYCDAEREVLLQVDRDGELIRSGEAPDRACESCGEVEYFDEDPATYFSFVAGQPALELSPQIAGFLAANLSYRVSEGSTRLRAEKQIEGRSTFLRLGGDLDGAFPGETLAEGVEGRLILELSGIGRVDPAGAAEWRKFVAAVGPVTESIFLVGAPPLFIEKLCSRDDLGPTTSVVSFGMPYRCQSCATTAVREIDVSEHFEVLRFATPPEMKCDKCGSPALCAAGESMLSQLPSLPPPHIDKDTRKEIAAFRMRRPERIPRATAATAASAPGSGGLAVALVAVLAAAALAIAAFFGWSYYRDRERAGDGGLERIAASAAERPVWITSDAVLAGRCTASDDSARCTGSSTLAADPQYAITEAHQSSLDAITQLVAERIAADDERWQSLVLEAYADARQSDLAAVASTTDTESVGFRTAADRVAAKRRAVAAAITTGSEESLGSPSESYTETFARKPDTQLHRAYTRLDVDADAIEALVSRFTLVTKTTLGAEVTDVFPGLVWRYPDLRRGALILAVETGPLQAMGLREGYIVTSVQGQPVSSGKQLGELLDREAKQLAESGGDLRMVLITGDGQPMSFVRPWPRPETASRGGGGGRRGNGAGTGVGPSFNTWEEAGGSADKSDNREDPAQ